MHDMFNRRRLIPLLDWLDNRLAQVGQLLTNQRERATAVPAEQAPGAEPTYHQVLSRAQCAQVIWTSKDLTALAFQAMLNRGLPVGQLERARVAWLVDDHNHPVLHVYWTEHQA